MKYFLCSLFLLASFIPVHAVSPGKLKIVIKKLQNNRGYVKLALFNNASGFPEETEKALKVLTLKISGNEAEVEIADLPPGQYAVSVYHDENANKEMDTNFLGIPKEGVGCSNNAKGFLGPPTYEDAKFSFSGTDRSMEIEIKYL